MPWRAYAEQYRQRDERIIESNQGEYSYEEHQTNKDGTIAWFKTSKLPLLDKTGATVGILCCFMDITEQREAETALAISESRHRNLIETTDTGYVVLDAHGCVVDANSIYVQLSGHRAKSEIIGRTPIEWTAQYSTEEKISAIGEFLASGDQNQSYEIDYQHSDGTIVPVAMNAAVIDSDHGKQILALCRNISDRRQAEKHLREKDLFLHGVLNDLLTYAGILDVDGRILFTNNTPLLESGLTLSDIQGSFFYDSPWWTYSDETRQTIKQDLDQCAAGIPVSRKIEAMMGSRGLRWISFSTHPVRDTDGNITRLIVEGRDIDEDVLEIKQAQAQLFKEKERLRITLHSIGDGVITTDTQGHIDFMNPVAETLTEWTLQKALGQSLADVLTIVSERDRQTCTCPVTECLEKNSVVYLGNHTALISQSGKEYSIQGSSAPIYGDSGALQGMVLVFADITESRQITKQLAFHASHDPLTELVNRREFKTRLRRAIQTTKEQGYQHVLCYLDLDRFKVVNDTCGHEAGDEMLRQITQLLNEFVRSRDTLARLGGDEFGMLMEHCALDQALVIAEKIRAAIKTLHFRWYENVFHVGVSIGIVAIKDSEKNTSDILGNADAACYAAKRAGRDRIQVYQDDDAKLSQQRDEVLWFSRITQALEHNHFCLYFHPIHSLDRPQTIRYELLVRMNSREDQLICPADFLPAADRYAITSKIDRWVLKNALNWLKVHPKHLEQLTHCAINLSGHSLGDETFLGFLTQLFEQTGVPPAKICLEITETAAIADLPSAQQFIASLQSQGCRFALDDFGIGLSSFAYLKNLSVDFVKIDGSFVKNMSQDSNDFAIVKSINDISHTMGKQTIAEFAENHEILKCLKEIGVDFAQGYAIGPPRPIEQLVSFAPSCIA